jgi:hypothetical protein
MKAGRSSIWYIRLEVVKAEGLRKTKNNVSKYSRYMGQNLNRNLLNTKYECYLLDRAVASDIYNICKYIKLLEITFKT